MAICMSCMKTEMILLSLSMTARLEISIGCMKKARERNGNSKKTYW